MMLPSQAVESGSGEHDSGAFSQVHFVYTRVEIAAYFS